MKQFLGPLGFVCFCFLIAFRDVLTEAFQVNIGSSPGDNVHPVYLLFVWCTECAVLAWLVRSIQNKSFSFIKPFFHLKTQQQIDFAYLGIATWIVYVITIYGIGALSSPVFNLIDYGTMPLLTLLTAKWINKEQISWQKVLGVAFSVGGIILLLYTFISRPPENSYWYIWIGLAFLSPFLTSICSSLQKRQVSENLAPADVLLYRFPIPALLMAIWFFVIKILEKPESPVPSQLSYLPALLIVGALTVFLPLWLLCYAFIRASVGQLASYLFLIAVFTFVLRPFVVHKPFDSLSQPAFWLSVFLFLIGYVVSEGWLFRPKSNQPQ